MTDGSAVVGLFLMIVAVVFCIILGFLGYFFASLAGLSILISSIIGIVVFAIPIIGYLFY